MVSIDGFGNECEFVSEERSTTRLLVPLFLTFPLDGDPIDIASRLLAREGKPGFVFERLDPGTRSPLYTYIGIDATAVTYSCGKLFFSRREPVVFADPITALQRHLARYKLQSAGDLPPFQGGVLALLGYDVVRYIEPGLERVISPPGFPEAVFLIAQTLIAVDHKKQVGFIIRLLGSDSVHERDRTYENLSDLRDRLLDRDRAKHVSSGEGAVGISSGDSFGNWIHNLSRYEFCRGVERIREHIAAGDLQQAILSIRMEKVLRADPYQVYLELRKANPSPYMCFMEAPGLALLGTPPQVFLRTEGNSVVSEVGAGTRPIVTSDKTTAELEAELLASEKDIAEGAILLDVVKRDLSRVARDGLVTIPFQMQLRKFSHVMHLFSQAKVDLRSGCTPLDAVWACFPPAPVSGVPKTTAIKLIAEIEGGGRGPYGGVVGLIGYDGHLDTVAVERTLWTSQERAYLQVGGGIVADSIPSAEHEECLYKARAILQSVERAEGRS